jgi:hypothetical protein
VYEELNALCTNDVQSADLFTDVVGEEHPSTRKAREEAELVL